MHLVEQVIQVVIQVVQIDQYHCTTCPYAYLDLINDTTHLNRLKVSKAHA